MVTDQMISDFVSTHMQIHGLFHGRMARCIKTHVDASVEWDDETNLIYTDGVPFATFILNKCLLLLSDPKKRTKLGLPYAYVAVEGHFTYVGNSDMKYFDAESFRIDEKNGMSKKTTLVNNNGYMYGVNMSTFIIFE